MTADTATIRYNVRTETLASGTSDANEPFQSVGTPGSVTELGLAESMNGPIQSSR